MAIFTKKETKWFFSFKFLKKCYKNENCDFHEYKLFKNAYFFKKYLKNAKIANKLGFYQGNEG